MSTILLDAPGLSEPARIDLPDGGVVLVGRAPDPAALNAGVAPAASVMAVASPSVSANHVLVTCSGGQVRVTDLGSRNGTWLRVPGRRAVAADDGGELRLQLAGTPAPVRADAEPDEPRYAGGEDYAKAMAASVAAWLARRGVTARVSVVRPPAGSDARGAPWFPLASGEQLHVACEQTLDAATQRRLEALRSWIVRQDVAFLAEEETRGDGMILASAGIRGAHQIVVDAARRGIPSLVLLGPPGAGKERLARAFHRHTGRGGPFVALNCSLLDRNLARADLFGAEPGAYTGIVRRRIGAVERAHGGTLFLDEIAEMPLDVQPLLLRFLDAGGEFERMGGDGRVRHADVRVVCATNQDLREASQREAFRQDLWWRLGVQVVEVPPLRRRFDDVLAYLRTRQLGAVSALDALQPAALEALRNHGWAGNFRELTNFVLRLPAVDQPRSIDEATVRRELTAGALGNGEEPRAEPLAEGDGSARWEEVARVAAQAFAEDHQRQAPASWSDVATFIEQYLKPVAVQRMVDAAGGDGGAPHARELAQRMQADSKTIAKHLRRYAERFGR